MATAKEVMDFAGKYVGYSRYADPEQGTVFGRWYAQLTSTPWFGTTGVAYCAMYVTMCLYLGKLSDPVKCIGFPTAACSPSMRAARSAGKLKRVQDGKLGDVIYFDWSRGGYTSDNADHVGFVRSVDAASKLVYTREGNVSGMVKDCVRNFADV
ncbi:MAG: CHAP domain-containing protein, partial [Atopobiaceae bacterium]|nr:CHAP domain-containing protein [Atopobiaceae bacterium]